jgi:ArpU family phage transcriptional regulator
MSKNREKLPKIHEKLTKKAVEEALEEYREFLVTLPTHMMPKVTPSYSIIPPSFTNEFHSSTESAALDRIEYMQARNEYLSWIQEAANTLKENERFIILKKYMNQELGYDPDIWTELGVGRTKYYEIKGQALLRLGFALQIEVYRRSEVKGV